MIIFAILTISFIFGIALICTSKYENAGVAGVILAVISGLFLTICLIELVVNPIEVKGDISKFLATKVTIEKTRKINYEQIDKLSDIKTMDALEIVATIAAIVENVALQHKIIESNQWLAKQQYHNSTIFELWVPDEVDKLKPMR
jgi:hypothetical protein